MVALVEPSLDASQANLVQTAACAADRLSNLWRESVKNRKNRKTKQLEVFVDSPWKDEALVKCLAVVSNLLAGLSKHIQVNLGVATTSYGER